jgi:hypothetical protein
MTTRTPGELAQMTPEEIAAWREAERRTVFGENYRTDRLGKPIETGIGSPGQESHNHFTALEKYEGKAAADAARARANKLAGTNRW